MRKNFLITRQPRETSDQNKNLIPERQPEQSEIMEPAVADPQPVETSPPAEKPQPVEEAATPETVRKTIELPKEDFWMVKRLAVDRRMREKEIWREILAEYRRNHPR